MSKNRVHSLRRSLAMLLTLLMLAGLLPTMAMAANFSDTEGHWASDVIGKWSADGYGIVNGYMDGTFNPDAYITRGAFAAILNRVMKYQTISNKAFTDLSSSAYYYEDILKLNAAGVINGTGDTTISGDSTIKREQAFAMLRRMFNVPLNESALSSFSDASEVSAWARGEVGGMVAAGYVQGSDGKLNPQGYLTRAQAVQVLENIIKAIYSEAGTYSVNTTGVVIVNEPGVVLKDMAITGNLYVSPGVGNGDCTLTNVNLKGDAVVMGGGKNSFIVGDGTVIDGTMTVYKTGDGSIRVVLEDGTEVPVVYVEDGSNEVIITGTVENLVVGEGVAVNAVGATIENVTVEGNGATFTVDKDSTINTLESKGADTSLNISGTIDNLKVEGSGTTVDTSSTAVIKDVTIDAGNTQVKGDGKVENVTVTESAGEGNVITTPNTAIDNKSNAPVAIDDKGGTVESGETGKTEQTTPPPTGGGDYTPSPSLAMTGLILGDANISGNTLNGNPKIATSDTTFYVLQSAAPIHFGFELTASNMTITNASQITLKLQKDAEPEITYPTLTSEDVGIDGSKIIVSGMVAGDIDAGTYKFTVSAGGVSRQVTIVVHDSISNPAGLAGKTIWAVGTAAGGLVPGNSSTADAVLSANVVSYTGPGNSTINYTLHKGTVTTTASGYFSGHDTLTIKDGATFVINTQDTLTVGTNAAIINEGTLTVNGTLTMNGTLNNSGTVDGTGAPAAKIDSTLYSTVQAAVDEAVALTDPTPVTIDVLNTTKDTTAITVGTGANTGKITIQGVSGDYEQGAFSVGIKILYPSVELKNLKFNITEDSKLVEFINGSHYGAVVAMGTTWDDVTIDGCDIRASADVARLFGIELLTGGNAGEHQTGEANDTVAVTNNIVVVDNTNSTHHRSYAMSTIGYQDMTITDNILVGERALYLDFYTKNPDISGISVAGNTLSGNQTAPNNGSGPEPDAKGVVWVALDNDDDYLDAPFGLAANTPFAERAKAPGSFDAFIGGIIGQLGIPEAELSITTITEDEVKALGVLVANYSEAEGERYSVVSGEIITEFATTDINTTWTKLNATGTMALAQVSKEGFANKDELNAAVSAMWSAAYSGGVFDASQVTQDYVDKMNAALSKNTQTIADVAIPVELVITEGKSFSSGATVGHDVNFSFGDAGEVKTEANWGGKLIAWMNTNMAYGWEEGDDEVVYFYIVKWTDGTVTRYPITFTDCDPTTP